MTDIKSQEARSRNMSAIKSKDTKPELFLRKKLFALGYRYRKNSSNIPGHPDIYLAKYKTAIFVNGCFWHRHQNCKYAYMPKTRIEFWQSKFSKNVERDKIVRQQLADMEIKELIVWECSIKKMFKDTLYCQHILSSIEKFLIGSIPYMEL